MIQLSIDDVKIDRRGGKPKDYQISDLNRSYLEAFQQAKYPEIGHNKKQRASYNQYKSTISNFLEAIGKDAAITKREEIDKFLAPFTGATKANKQAHIKSFLIYLITANYKNVTSKISRDLLIKLLEM